MRRTKLGWLLFFVALVLSVPGCGSGDEVGGKQSDGDKGGAAGSSASANAGDAGAKDDANASKKPDAGASSDALQTPATEANDETEDDLGSPLVPPSLKEALAAIDLKSFPVMDGAIRVQSTPLGSHFSIANADKATIAKTIEFYRTHLAEAGWKAAADPKLWQIFDEGAQMVYVKQGYRLGASMGISRGDGNLNARLVNLANLDSRRLPRIAGAEVTDARPESTLYLTEAKRDAIKAFLRAEMKKQGWFEFDPPELPGVAQHLTMDENTLGFLSRAAAVGFTLQPQQKPQEGKIRVIASVRVLEQQFPIMPDATKIEFGQHPQTIFYRTAASPEQVLELHQKEFAALGWKQREGAGNMDETKATLAFDAPEQAPLRFQYLKTQRTIFVTIAPWPSDAK